jgi:hypothetical protein
LGGIFAEGRNAKLKNRRDAVFEPIPLLSLARLAKYRIAVIYGYLAIVPLLEMAMRPITKNTPCMLSLFL